MLNIANHQRNANQNHGITSYMSKWLSSKKKNPQIANVGKDVVKRKFSYDAGVNVNWCSHYSKQYGGFSKN